MTLKTLTIKSLQDLASHIKSKEPSFYYSSQTSTVIPYDKIESLLLNTTLVNLGQIKGTQNMVGDSLVCEGAVTWKDSRQFAQQNDRQVMTYPTEELANVLAGVATSCTGERCFGYGTLRDQIVSLKFMNNNGETHELSSKRKLSDHDLFLDNQDLLKRYQKTYEKYQKFKNAPFPRLEMETDLLTGTEGQLGIVTEVTLKTTDNDNLEYLFFALDPWEIDDSIHLEIFEKVQTFRSQINSCELIDANSLSYLDDEMIPVKGKDLIFFEIPEKNFENVYNDLLQKISIPLDRILQMSGSKFQQLRVAVPRAIFETNSKMGVVKKGTDVQATPQNFKKLLATYREFSKSGIRYNLFGHFGDAHLHFNFMPTKDQVSQGQGLLLELYDRVLKEEGSPFAEHGIGLLKQDFIKKFWGPVHFEMFEFLKTKMDPDNIFFPQGYMSK